MKRAIGVCTLVLAFAAVAFAQEPTIDETIQQFDRTLTNLIALLKDVKDQTSARAASERVSTADKQLGPVYERMNRSKARPSPAARKTLTESTKHLNDLESQVKRIAEIPKAAELLDKVPTTKSILKELNDGRVEVAKASVRYLTTAVQAFEIKYGDPPARLELLLTPPDGGRAFVEKDSLLDPWGRPYQFDPQGLKNKGLKPDVWSQGPDPNDKTKIIGNWPDDKKEDKKPGPA